MNLGQENEQQEFKLSLSQLDKGLRSLSAMLNRGAEGTVYFGVDDDGTVKGINIGKRTLLDVRSRAAELIEPRIMLEIQPLKDENGLDYLRVYAQGSNIPYACDGRYYLRTASADEQASTDLLRRMLVSGNTDVMTEMSAAEQSLTFSGMVRFLSEKGIHASQTAQFLKSFGMYNREGKFNLLAYLLSDQNQLVIKIQRFAGVDKTTVDERVGFSGQSLLLTVQQVLSYFQLLQMPRKVDLSTGVRVETALFDLQAFREAWINACVHNDWAERIPPAVYLFDDRIEVVSYGGLPYGLSREGFFSGTSKPVNSRLFNIFINCDYTEQSGHGIPQIVRVYGREAFSFRDGMLIVTLPFAFEPDYVKARKYRESISEALTQNQTLVLEYFRIHPNATMKEVSLACNISYSGVKKIVAKLQEAQMIERQGPKKNSIWRVR